MFQGNLAVEGAFNQEQDSENHLSEISVSPPVMADYSSSSPIFLQPPAPQLMPIQLTENNYILWKSLFIPVLKAYNMLNHAEGREQCPPQILTTDEDEKENRRENPAYTIWIQRDQMFLTWINASLSPKLLCYTRECTSGRALWVHLEDVLSKSAEAHCCFFSYIAVFCLGSRPASKTLNLTYWTHWKNISARLEKYIADELEVAGSPINDRELTSCILEGLPEFYEEVVASIKNKPHPVTQKELHDLLLSHRTRKNAQARVPGLKARLQNLNFSRYYDDMRAYLKKAQAISDGLEAAGSPVNDRELTSRILEGLPKRYDKLVASITNQLDPGRKAVSKKPIGATSGKHLKAKITS
ncbi:hypothetical protein ACLB2K_035694 [Fragaria x ananassa]